MLSLCLHNDNDDGSVRGAFNKFPNCFVPSISLKNKITDNYKIDFNNTINQINKDTCSFDSKLHIEDKLRKFKKKDAYILIKDHKPNFENKLHLHWLIPQKQRYVRYQKYYSKYCN